VKSVVGEIADVAKRLKNNISRKIEWYGDFIPIPDIRSLPMLNDDELVIFQDLSKKWIVSSIKSDSLVLRNFNLKPTLRWEKTYSNTEEFKEQCSYYIIQMIDTYSTLMTKWSEASKSPGADSVKCENSYGEAVEKLERWKEMSQLFDKSVKQGFKRPILIPGFEFKGNLPSALEEEVFANMLYFFKKKGRDISFIPRAILGVKGKIVSEFKPEDGRFYKLQEMIKAILSGQNPTWKEFKTPKLNIKNLPQDVQVLLKKVPELQPYIEANKNKLVPRKEGRGTHILKNGKCIKCELPLLESEVDKYVCKPLLKKEKTNKFESLYRRTKDSLTKDGFDKIEFGPCKNCKTACKPSCIEKVLGALKKDRFVGTVPVYGVCPTLTGIKFYCPVCLDNFPERIDVVSHFIFKHATPGKLREQRISLQPLSAAIGEYFICPFCHEKCKYQSGLADFHSSKACIGKMKNPVYIDEELQAPRKAPKIIPGSVKEKKPITPAYIPVKVVKPKQGVSQKKKDVISQSILLDDDAVLGEQERKNSATNEAKEKKKLIKQSAYLDRILKKIQNGEFLRVKGFEIPFEVDSCPNCQSVDHFNFECVPEFDMKSEKHNNVVRNWVTEVKKGGSSKLPVHVIQAVFGDEAFMGRCPFCEKVVPVEHIHKVTCINKKPVFFCTCGRSNKRHKCGECDKCDETFTNWSDHLRVCKSRVSQKASYADAVKVGSEDVPLKANPVPKKGKAKNKKPKSQPAKPAEQDIKKVMPTLMEKAAMLKPQGARRFLVKCLEKDAKKAEEDFLSGALTSQNFSQWLKVNGNKPKPKETEKKDVKVPSAVEQWKAFRKTNKAALLAKPTTVEEKEVFRKWVELKKLIPKDTPIPIGFPRKARFFPNKKTPVELSPPKDENPMEKIILKGVSFLGKLFKAFTKNV
jgi:hypothetical protein